MLAGDCSNCRDCYWWWPFTAWAPTATLKREMTHPKIKGVSFRVCLSDLGSGAAYQLFRLPLYERRSPPMLARRDE